MPFGLQTLLEFRRWLLTTWPNQAGTGVALFLSSSAVGRWWQLWLGCLHAGVLALAALAAHQIPLLLKSIVAGHIHTYIHTYTGWPVMAVPCPRYVLLVLVWRSGHALTLADVGSVSRSVWRRQADPQIHTVMSGLLQRCMPCPCCTPGGCRVQPSFSAGCHSHCNCPC
jgi:hypothetical protein